MSTLAPSPLRATISAPRLGAALVTTPSSGISDVSTNIETLLDNLRQPSPTFSGTRSEVGAKLPVRLYDLLADFKIFTAQIAMHIDRQWRDRLFAQLDSLLDVNEWDEQDAPPVHNSYATFLRMLLSIKPERRPGLGAAANGNLIAAWTNGNDKLTIECLANDEIRWSIARDTDEMRVRAAGIDSLRRLSVILEPYEPQKWFRRA